MSHIWLFFLLASLVSGGLSGQLSHLSVAAIQGAQEGVQLSLALAGALCLWSAVSRVMEKSGLSEKLSQLLSPFLSRIFPETCRDGAARSFLCANFTANLLGLGSAATPMGVSCVRRMQEFSRDKKRASNEMCRLIVMNTASIQLLPATIASVRSASGCETPFDILPAVWLASALSVLVGVTAAKLLAAAGRCRR